MKNFIQKGEVLTFVAPAGGVVSGTPVVINTTVLVPAFSAAEGYECEGVTEGVFSFPKVGADTPAQFDAAYWDGSAVTTDSLAGDQIGFFVETLEAGTTEAAVKIG